MGVICYTANNKIRLLECGAEFFPSLVAAFDGATTKIYLETYIFAADVTGDAVKAALKRAAARGVSVQVLTDWVGTGPNYTKLLHEELLAAGVRHHSFNPWFRRGIARTHRKICVVDRKIAFLGGLNINYDMLADDDSGLPLPWPRWDFAVKLEGPLVEKIHQEVASHWAWLGNASLRSQWERLTEKGQACALKKGHHEPALAALVLRDNLRNRTTIQRSYLQALGKAQHEAWLTTPYFAPGRKLRDALSEAAKRGVKVTLLLGVGQYRLQDAVTHAFYPKLLASGVQVIEYRKTQLHGKVAVVDNEWATVGSSNHDGFSLFVNQEANIVVKDVEFAAALREHIAHGAAEGVPISLEYYTNIPWYKRAWYSTAYVLYRSMLRIIMLGRYTE